jgi:hypothetical protein
MREIIFLVAAGVFVLIWNHAPVSVSVRLTKYNNKEGKRSERQFAYDLY